MSQKRFLIFVLIIALTACTEESATSPQLTATPGAALSLSPLPTISVASTPLSTAVPSLPPSPEQSAAWRIRFKMSGGFAGIIRSVELSDDGLLRAVDQRTGRQSAIQISVTDLEEIRTWVMNAQPMPPLPRFSDCRDCLRYEVTIYRGNETITAELTDLNLDQSVLSPLINKLAALQETALSEGQ